jgi:hypothetical protein
VWPPCLLWWATARNKCTTAETNAQQYWISSIYKRHPLVIVVSSDSTLFYKLLFSITQIIFEPFFWLLVYHKNTNYM